MIEVGATDFSGGAFAATAACRVKWWPHFWYVPLGTPWENRCKRRVYGAPYIVQGNGNPPAWSVTYGQARSPDSVYPGGRSLRSWWQDAANDILRSWNEYGWQELVLTTFHEGNAAAGWAWNWHQHSGGAWTNFDDFWATQAAYIDTVRAIVPQAQFAIGPIGVWGQYQYGTPDTQTWLPPDSIKDRFQFVGLDMYDSPYYGLVDYSSWSAPSDAGVDSVWNNWWRPQLDPVRAWCAANQKGLVVPELGLCHRWPHVVTPEQGNDWFDSRPDANAGGDNPRWLQNQWDYWRNAIDAGVPRVIVCYHNSDADKTSRIDSVGSWGGQPRSVRFPLARAKLAELCADGSGGAWGE